MSDPFPFVKVSSKDEEIVGKADPGTRIHRRTGRREDGREWTERVFQICARGAISPGGVSMYANVSRAAIYKAINEGRLTAFGFHVVTESRSVFGFRKKTREMPYMFVPSSEAAAWGDIVAAKIKAQTWTREDEPGLLSPSDYLKLEDGVHRGKYPKKSKAKK